MTDDATGHEGDDTPPYSPDPKTLTGLRDDSDEGNEEMTLAKQAIVDFVDVTPNFVRNRSAAASEAGIIAVEVRALIDMVAFSENRSDCGISSLLIALGYHYPSMVALLLELREAVNGNGASFPPSRTRILALPTSISRLHDFLYRSLGKP